MYLKNARKKSLVVFQMVGQSLAGFRQSVLWVLLGIKIRQIFEKKLEYYLPINFFSIFDS